MDSPVLHAPPPAIHDDCAPKYPMDAELDVCAAQDPFGWGVGVGVGVGVGLGGGIKTVPIVIGVLMMSAPPFSVIVTRYVPLLANE